MKLLSKVLVVGFIWWVVLLGAGQDTTRPYGPYNDRSWCQSVAREANLDPSERPAGSYYDCRWFW